MDTFTIQDAPLNMAPTGIATFAKVIISRQGIRV